MEVKELKSQLVLPLDHMDCIVAYGIQQAIAVLSKAKSKQFTI